MSCRGEENLALTYQLKNCPICGRRFEKEKQDPKVCLNCSKDFCYIDEILCVWNRSKMKWIPIALYDGREKVVFT